MDRISLDASLSSIPHSENGDMNFLAILKALRNRKLLIIGLPLIFSILGALLSLAIPNTYRASTKILPREQSLTNTATLLNQLGNADRALSIRIPIDPNSRHPVELYIGILKSRSIGDSLVRRFDLKKAYGVKTNEQARIHLSARTLITSGRDGLISIEVEDKLPVQASQIANAYIEELLKMAKSLALTSSSQRRNYYERQFQLAQEKLNAAQAASKSAPAVAGRENADIRPKMRDIVQLRAQIEAKEIQLSALQAFSSEDNSELTQGQREVARLRAELAKLEADDATAGSTQHDINYYQYLSGMLARHLADARREETRDASLIQVLDAAVTPERHSSPNRPFIVEIAFLSGLMVALLWIFMQDVMPKRQTARRDTGLLANLF